MQKAPRLGSDALFQVAGPSGAMLAAGSQHPSRLLAQEGVTDWESG